MSPTPFYIRALRQCFEKRLERNPHYTLRAFAASLEINSGACSQLLSGKRIPSTTVANRLMDRLGLDLKEREAFLQCLGRQKMKQGLKRLSPTLRRFATSARNHSEHTRQDLSVDAFQAVSRWYYYAVLELTKLPHFQESPKWISRELGISEAEAKIALDRLLELGMLERTEGRIRKSHASFYSADPHLTTAAHRRRQLEILGKSANALESEPISLRNHSGMTVAIDPALIPEAKKRITRFLQELSDFLESGGPKRVYEIHLGLFPLQSPKSKTETEVFHEKSN